MRFAETAQFDTTIVKNRCAELGIDFTEFEELCKKLEGKVGHYNRWMDLVHDKHLYDFKTDDGELIPVPVDLVKQLH